MRGAAIAQEIAVQLETEPDTAERATHIEDLMQRLADRIIEESEPRG